MRPSTSSKPLLRVPVLQKCRKALLTLEVRAYQWPWASARPQCQEDLAQNHLVGSHTVIGGELSWGKERARLEGGLDCWWPPPPDPILRVRLHGPTCSSLPWQNSLKMDLRRAIAGLAPIS